MVFATSKSITASRGLVQRNNRKSYISEDAVAKRKGNVRGKITNAFSFCKIFLFVLFLWIIQYSPDCTPNEGINKHNIVGAGIDIRGNRLLAQPFIEFDAVFDVYQKSFLDKMGIKDEEKDQIKNMMKSYFDKIDIEALGKQFQQNPGMFPPIGPNMLSCLSPNMFPPIDPSMFPPVCPNTCPKDNTNVAEDNENKEKNEKGKTIQIPGQNIMCQNNTCSPVARCLNYFNFLWSPSFISLGSIISIFLGQYKVFLALLSILFLKTVNFFWNIKFLHDQLFPKALKI
ncbi:Plasmodium exported protein, unknown function [Plasmodium ovale]|uniref:Pv-fam-h protein n=2 Tax=Plasmodium ovale TaxID=36330 RepID=A0A1A8X8P6_PLAOA|nr:Plasmodium exported protein, unknown function [Plasmodium ovale curtisi]SBT01616.1 Plasmodium exported protein, unknown function [Plasmodium ovale curtisi]SBT84522.1 Plasmodium exported protein, unknown function [Plasmodium ovale]